MVVLPAPLGPMKPKTSPSAEFQRQIIHGPQRAVGFGQILGLDHGRGFRVRVQGK